MSSDQTTSVPTPHDDTTPTTDGDKAQTTDTTDASNSDQKVYASVAEKHGQKTLEEDENILYKERAVLYRLDREAKEWKERGTGVVKFLEHKDTGKVRILMRRDKTLKICANHYILPHMSLKANAGSDRSWVWTTLADFADEQEKPEVLAIKFASSDLAKEFEAAFGKAKQLNEKAIASEPEPSKD
eukprot:CAMPEP_0201551694 /NCGR_PEP_ID=MMETSP0173_2-20130828/9135_1 /ASSEMBLY_ACC=CAM_ASM_000268 /TAXON_ID=218659 /ORGANISM="Vexillifera sp., Strain DIVA3 564/2" /LENGTH=185 /DNA_ID=CAMNT_0047962015 /DNA_START=41 /DNA_END=598 /DNA_ORIENTATION=+